ncbi:DedA family protein [Glacieibacterium frigidum]|uniref:VTT domain-containing protein n=1 Tax=Glacieibacterium frigidum TaxID=2593303 RepID=A0A552UH34_9SPHN|nr:VTT domain-containing protein [Glacieibacterium frigidum]TRW17534.1 hypothetical protein FMM06_05110 [Glacieibacterium frigidum]
MDNWLIATLDNAMLSPVFLFVALVAATFVLEDVATVAAGILAGRMSIDPFTAVAAVIVGTIAGDLALYAVGRWLGTSRLATQFRARSDGRLEDRLRRHGLMAVAVARFVPGTRLPIFFGSGVVRTPLAKLTLVIVGTTLVWTPALFVASSQAGGALFTNLNAGTIALAAGVLAAVMLAPRLFARRSAALA